MTQGDASLVASTHRNGSVPFRRNWAVAESRAETAAGRPHQLAGTDGPHRRGGPRSCPGSPARRSPPAPPGLGRVVRHMVVDDPADPLAAAGPDVLVVLGARLPPADPANCRALVERLDSMGTAALAFRRTEGPAPVPGRGPRRGRPPRPARPGAAARRPPGRDRLRGARHRRHQAGPGARAVLPHGRRVHRRSPSPAAGWPRSPSGWPCMLDGTAVLGLGPDREVVTSAGPRGRRRRRSATGSGCSTPRPTTRSPS